MKLIHHKKGLPPAVVKLKDNLIETIKVLDLEEAMGDIFFHKRNCPDLLYDN